MESSKASDEDDKIKRDPEVIFRRTQESAKFEGLFKYRPKRSYKYEYTYRDVDGT